MSRRVPPVRQMEEADCGAACLAMVLGYFGKRVELDDVREMTGTGRDGVTALTLLRAARAYGLEAQGVQAEIDDLERLPPGSILHWSFSHFVVFERRARDGIRVVDPAQGRRLVPMDEVRRAYTGVAMTFEPTDSFDRTGSAAQGTWRYLRPILGQSRTLLRVTLTSLLIRLVALGLPLLTAILVDEILPRSDRHLLVVLAAGVAMIVGYQFLSSFVRANLLLELRTRLDIGLTTGFVNHLVELPYAFFLRRSSGDLMMRLGSNTAVRDILTAGTLAAILDGAFAALYLILLFIVSPLLAGLVLFIALLQIVTLIASWRMNQRLMAESLQAQSDAQSYAYQMLAGIETLKAAGAEHRSADRWRGLFTNQINVDIRRGRLDATVQSILSALRISAPLLILLVGAFQVLEGNLTLGTMLAVSALAVGFLEPLATMIASGLQLQVVASYMERINDVLDKPREQEGQQVRPAGRLRGRVRAEAVTFSYSPLSPVVVRDVSLDIRPGQHIGIVGRSGSGKSTLAHLLLGLYPPTSGRVEFDGEDLKDLDVTSVRRQMGIVTQRPYLFGASIRENIALTNPLLPLDEVMVAARLACIHDDIVAMPLGYDTRLHDGGTSLSGGQRQRLALARALAQRPAILLLDEATSELDTVSERMVYENLLTLPATTIVIAHRLSTVRDADLIVVMDQGAVVETGTHAELTVRQGMYWSLLNAHRSLDETKADGVPVPPSATPHVTDMPTMPSSDGAPRTRREQPSGSL